MSTALLESLLVYVGIFAFALSGALLGVRRGFDIVGMAVLATATGLGGGILRDVLLGQVPPTALEFPALLLIPLGATAVTFFFHTLVDRLRRAVEVTDAVGLGVFCATATAFALSLGAEPVAAVLLGSISGVGGGLLRDVLAGVTPALFTRDSRLYAIPAVVGSTAVAVAGVSGLTTGGMVQTGAALLVIVLRIGALWRGWTAPMPRVRATTTGETSGATGETVA